MRVAFAITSLCLVTATLLIAGLGAQEPVVEVYKSPT